MSDQEKVRFDGPFGGSTLLASGREHVIREYDGGAGCATCPDIPLAVYLPERTAYFCARELLAEVERLRPCETDLRLARAIDAARDQLAAEVERLRAAIRRAHGWLRLSDEETGGARNVTNQVAEAVAILTPLAHEK